MKSLSELVPWNVTDISFRPHRHFWSMNPSIHFDGDRWRCVLRCCDYCMRGGVTVRSRKSRGGARTKNVMAIFDPKGWRPVEIYKMREQDTLPRGSSDNVGYEDVRLFQTDAGGLQGIAASQHLRRSHRHRPLPEQVLLSFDAAYNIVGARPIRGPWDDLPQKNWAPFDRCVEPRFLYAIGRGTLFDSHGPLQEDAALVRPSTRGHPLPHVPDEGAIRRARERAIECEEERARRHDPHERSSFGRVNPAPNYEGLRGGTQLARVGDETWIGLGHQMQIVKERKYYYHTWYLVDARGALTSASEPMKLAPDSGIEFAAGLAIDGDRAVVSFGVDDYECKIGETSLSAVLETLRPVER